MPRSILSRASTENLTSLADISVAPQISLRSFINEWNSTVPRREGSSRGLLARLNVDQHAHDVAFLHDQVFDAVELDLGTGPFAEQHPVAGRDIDGNELARLVASAGADGDDFALARLLLGVIGDDDAGSRLALGLDTLDDDPIMQRAEFHRSLLVRCLASSALGRLRSSRAVLPIGGEFLGAPPSSSHRAKATTWSVDAARGFSVGVILSTWRRWTEFTRARTKRSFGITG